MVRKPRQALAQIALLVALPALSLAGSWTANVALDDTTSAALEGGRWSIVDWTRTAALAPALGDTLRFFADVPEAPSVWGLWRWDRVLCACGDSLSRPGRREPSLVRLWFVGAPGRTRFVHVIDRFPAGDGIGDYQLSRVEAFAPELEECCP